MAKQIVTLGNKVVAHGEDCFLTMGGTVICQNTGRTFVNATVTACSCDIPADIDSVGYEYHAGVFVPDGTLPYNTFYNGGLPVPARIVYGTYTGINKYGSSNPNTLTFDFAPLLVCVFTQPKNAQTHLFWTGEMHLTMCRGITEQPWCKDPLGTPQWTQAARKIVWGDNSVSWYANLATGVSGGASVQWNESGVTYYYVAIG